MFCQFSVKYYGDIFDHTGISVDQSKVEAICKIPAPLSVIELQRFMGMVNYLSSFIPNHLANVQSLNKSIVKKYSLVMVRSAAARV